MRKRKSQSPNSHQPKIPICKRRGDGAENLHLSTREDPKPIPKKEVILPQVPPQSELLAQEYAHSLQQQNYLLDSEIRFLRDRTGVDDAENGGPGIDSSIRRLRRAMAMHEEETNATIADYEQKIHEQTEALQQIDENEAEIILQSANEQETNGFQDLEDVYVDLAGEVHKHQYQTIHFKNSSTLFSEKKTELEKLYENNQFKKEKEDQDLSSLNKQIEEIHSNKEVLLTQLKEAIKRKRLADEQIDVSTILINLPEPQQANIPLSNIQAKNSKLQIELKAAIQNRDEIESQVDELLEKNVRLKAQLNEAKSQIQYGKQIKAEMEKQFSGVYKSLKDTYDQQLMEIAALKRNRKEMKQEIENLTLQFNETVMKINSNEGEKKILHDVIQFKKAEKTEIDEENRQTKKEIQKIKLQNEEKYQELNQLAHDIAEAGQKLRKLEVIVEINNQDQRCHVETPPPELLQLLQSLNAVKDAIQS